VSNLAQFRRVLVSNPAQFHRLLVSHPVQFPRLPAGSPIYLISREPAQSILVSIHPVHLRLNLLVSNPAQFHRVLVSNPAQFRRVLVSNPARFHRLLVSNPVQCHRLPARSPIYLISREPAQSILVSRHPVHLRLNLLVSTRARFHRVLVSTPAQPSPLIIMLTTPTQFGRLIIIMLSTPVQFHRPLLSTPAQFGRLIIMFTTPVRRALVCREI
jgi:hypothetical protein